MSRKPLLTMLFAVALLLAIGAVAAPAECAAFAGAPGPALAASDEFPGTTIGPRTVYWLEAAELAAAPVPQQDVPNAVTATSFRAATFTPNVPLYIGALLVMAGGLWAAVYRMGRATKT